MCCDTGQKFRCLNDATASKAYSLLSPFNLGTGSIFGCTGVVLRRIQHVDVMDTPCRTPGLHLAGQPRMVFQFGGCLKSSTILQMLVKRCERRHIWTLSITISWKEAPVLSQSFIFMLSSISRCFLQFSRLEFRDLFGTSSLAQNKRTKGTGDGIILKNC